MVPRLTEVFNVEEASQELEEKSHGEIEKETAEKWGARAVAAYQKAQTGGSEDGVTWLRKGDDYRHEALEHAAMSEIDGLLEEIKAEIDAVRDQTFVEF